MIIALLRFYRDFGIYFSSTNCFYSNMPLVLELDAEADYEADISLRYSSS